MITHLDFELSSICNAGCPVCSRRQYGSYNLFEQTYWKFDDVKRVVGKKLLNQLSFFNVCGNFGDGMGNPDIVKIAEWVKSNNPGCTFHISTNGGIGSKEDYKELAKLGVGITFGIDGYGDKNELYRINAKWDKVYENFITFAKYSNTPERYLRIQFLLWDQTRDQIKLVFDFAKANNVTELQFLKPFTHTADYTRAFNMKGEYTHSLTFTDNSIIHQLSTEEWTSDRFAELNRLLNDSQLETLPLVKEKNQDFKVPIRKRKKYIPRKAVFSADELKKVKSFRKQSCYSYNADSRFDLTKESNNLYITYNRYLMPCCMIPPQYSLDINHSTGNETPYQVEILNSLDELGIENFSLKEKTIQEVYDSGILHKFVYNKFKNNSQFNFCKITCGKCEQLI